MYSYIIESNLVTIHLNKIIELCLTVFCLYFIILYNTTGMSHLKAVRTWDLLSRLVLSCGFPHLFQDNSAVPPRSPTCLMNRPQIVSSHHFRCCVSAYVVACRWKYYSPHKRWQTIIGLHDFVTHDHNIRAKLVCHETVKNFRCRTYTHAVIIP